MPAIAFPPIKPTGRSYSPGRYAQSEFQALNGATSIVRFGSQRYDSELSLDFDNIVDSGAALILANYERQNAGDHWVSFDASNGTAGASQELAKYLGETVTELRWRYAEPPQVRSVMPGRSSVTVKMKGYLDSERGVPTLPPRHGCPSDEGGYG
jgi:hypothetical protein